MHCCNDGIISHPKYDLYIYIYVYANIHIFMCILRICVYIYICLCIIYIYILYTVPTFTSADIKIGQLAFFTTSGSVRAGRLSGVDCFSRRNVAEDFGSGFLESVVEQHKFSHSVGPNM